jgi:conjugal transfer pilus assembly protein TraK
LVEPPAAVLAVGPKTLTVSPGTTTIVEVAIDHLNRIVTPFAAPQVRTVSPATTQVDGNVVYVATSSEEPVGLFITEAGDTSNALSLTLAPRHIPPREVRLVLSGGGFMPVVAPARPPRVSEGEGDQPYVEQLVAAFRALAQDRLPAGYGPGVPARGERIDCRLPGVTLTTTRVLDGGRLRLLTARAENRGQSTVELAEHRCTVGKGTAPAAIAFWPHRRLAPGGETEVYVAVRPAEAGREERTSTSPQGAGR